MKYNEEILKQCPVLIGPSNVGKTLISETLSKKLNIPVISIDEVFVFVNNELKGYLSQDAFTQQQFILDRSYVCNHFKDLKVNKRDRELKRKQKAMIKDHVELYNEYNKLLGGFSKFYDIAMDYASTFHELDKLEIEDHNTIIALFQFYHLKALVKVMQSLKQPAIIDTASFQGWKLPISDICEHDKTELAKCGLFVDVEQIKKGTEATFNLLGPVIFIEPGIDFETRIKNSNIDDSNNHLKNNLFQYNAYADFCISANGIFHDVENKAFSTRYYYDAKAMAVKESLLNKGELANICDAIAEELENLKQFEK